MPKFKITAKDVNVPADVPKSKKAEYIKNHLELTKKSGNLFLFAGDQKIEHLNSDFYGKGIAKDDNNPEHLFRIAKQGKVGVFASQLGLIAHYGNKYKTVPYLIKLNAKTNLVDVKQKDPYSEQINTVQQVMEVKKDKKLKILGVGYTLYLGSEFETDMIAQVSRIIYNAHKNGLVTVIWIYPRGKAVKDEKHPDIIAGATGVGASLGADFVKEKGKKSAQIFQQAIESAGTTKVICAGGSNTKIENFLKDLHDQIHISGAHGNATGRNLHQRELQEAVKLCKAISAIVIEGKTVEQAMKIYKK